MDKLKNKNIEIREYPLELRAADAEDGNPYFEGTAASYDTESSVLHEWMDGEWTEFVEVIARGAFDAALADPEADIIFNVDHRDSNMLARFKPAEEIRTLSLTASQTGLGIRADKPNTTLGNDTFEHVKLGNLRHMSFAFTVDKAGEEWSKRADGMLVRTITSFKRIYDVAIVRNPAYNGHNATSINVAQRSGQNFDPAKTTPNEQTTSTTHPGYGYEYELLKLKSQSI